MKRRALLGVGAVAMQAAFARDVGAQVRWDVGVDEGVGRRVLASRPARQGDAGFGPTLDASAHLALIPLVRVGVYAHHDASPVPGGATRDLFSGGVDARLGLPWLRGDVRAYLRVGLGEVGTAASARAIAGGRFLAASSGNFSEVPLAIGFVYRVQQRLSLTAELGARLGFAFRGSAYGAATSGDDVLAVAAALGVAWGR